MTLLADLEPMRWLFLASAFAVVFWLLVRTQRQVQRSRSGGAALAGPLAPDAGACRGEHALQAGASVPGLHRPARTARSTAVGHMGYEETLAETRHAEIQLHELARDLVAQIDSKAALLTALLREAQAEAARLERLLAAAPPAHASTQAAALVSAAASCCDTVHDALHPQPATTRPRTEIHQLADLGLTPAQIAERTHCLQGEVELILGLRKHTPS